MSTQKRTILHDFIASLRGIETVFTEGSIRRGIFMLSIPMILEMIFESLFAVVDIFWVGRYSSDAIAVVGLTESAEFIVYSICIGVSMAVTAMVARRVGEKKPEKAAEVAVQTIWIMLIISAVIGVLGFLFSEEILLLLGAEQALATYGKGYTKIIFCANINVMFIYGLNAVFRGSGNAAIAMIVLGVANVLNIILDPIFIFGAGPIPSFGLEGAAIATTIGRGIGVLVLFGFLFFGQHSVRVRKGMINWQPKIIIQMLKTSIGGIGQFIISSASWIFIVRIIAGFGTAAVAGYTVAFRIMMFSLLPIWGMGQAAATLVGQNLGAGKPDRAEKSVWLTSKYNAILMAIVTITYLLSAPFIVSLFTKESEVITYAIEGLRITSIGFVFFSLGMVTSMGFNGAGDTKTPTLLNFIAYWVVQIPVAYALAHFTNLDTSGVYIAVNIAALAFALYAVYLFRQGKWKETIV